MNKKQEQILKAAQRKLKNEAVLSGGSNYINPIRKPQAKKPTPFWKKLFS